jgi:hypothetical protein
MCRIRLSQGISRHQQLQEKSAATALNTVLHPNGLVVNLMEQPDNKTPETHLCSVPLPLSLEKGNVCQNRYPAEAYPAQIIL